MNTIARLMATLATEDGILPTRVPGVKLFRSSESKPRQPLLYEKGIIIVGQGSKRVFLGNQAYEYNCDTYLVLALPIPAECETRATATEPLLSMAVDIDLTILNSIIQQMDTDSDVLRVLSKKKQQGVFVSSMTASIRGTIIRLLTALQSPLESAMLGTSLVRELMFRIMCSENAGSLYALAMKNTNLSKVDKALQRIHGHYQHSMNVAELAGLVNMSPSAFHRAFKEATSSSPVQYIKKIRLSKAQNLLAEQGLRVNEAAAKVGYESTPQFSREFKRYFGISPGASINAAGPV